MKATNRKRPWTLREIGMNLMVSAGVASFIGGALALGWDSSLAGAVAWFVSFLMMLDLTFNGSGLEDHCDDRPHK